jgi:hypothetical protein
MEHPNARRIPDAARKEAGNRSETVLLIAQLKEEVRQLRDAVDSHAVIDQAIGAVMFAGRLQAREVIAVLVKISQNGNVRVRTLAERIVAEAAHGKLPAEIARAVAGAENR